MNPCDYLQQLIAIAEPALCSEPPEAPPHLLALAGETGAEELLQLLQMKNGFYALARALHVFPTCASHQGFDLVAWNEASLWRGATVRLRRGSSSLPKTCSEISLLYAIIGSGSLIPKQALRNSSRTLWRGGRPAFCRTLRQWVLPQRWLGSRRTETFRLESGSFVKSRLCWGGQ